VRHQRSSAGLPATPARFVRRPGCPASKRRQAAALQIERRHARVVAFVAGFSPASCRAPLRFVSPTRAVQTEIGCGLKSTRNLFSNNGRGVGAAGMALYFAPLRKATEVKDAGGDAGATKNNGATHPHYAFFAVLRRPRRRAGG
jgi:hypothetical protein